MRLKYNTLSIICLILTCWAAVIGQEQPYRLQSDRIAGAGISFEYWKAGSDKVNEIAVPVTFLLPINEKLRFYAMTSPTFSNLNTGVSYSLGGMWGRYSRARRNDIVVLLQRLGIRYRGVRFH